MLLRLLLLLMPTFTPRLRTPPELWRLLILILVVGAFGAAPFEATDDDVYADDGAVRYAPCDEAFACCNIPHSSEVTETACCCWCWLCCFCCNGRVYADDCVETVWGMGMAFLKGVDDDDDDADEEEEEDEEG